MFQIQVQILHDIYTAIPQNIWIILILNEFNNDFITPWPMETQAS